MQNACNGSPDHLTLLGEKRKAKSEKRKAKSEKRKAKSEKRKAKKRPYWVTIITGCCSAQELVQPLTCVGAGIVRVIASFDVWMMVVSDVA